MRLPLPILPSSGSPVSSSSAPWPAFTSAPRHRHHLYCSSTAGTSPPLSKGMNLRRTCLGSPTRRGSSAPGLPPITARVCRHSLYRNAFLRSSGQYRGHDRGGRLHHNSPRRLAMKPGKREERGGIVHRLTTIIDQAVGIIRWIGAPSLAHLMLRRPLG